jgi:hypothetical protein
VSAGVDCGTARREDIVIGVATVAGSTAAGAAELLGRFATAIATAIRGRVTVPRTPERIVVTLGAAAG